MPGENGARTSMDDRRVKAYPLLVSKESDRGSPWGGKVGKRVKAIENDREVRNSWKEEKSRGKGRGMETETREEYRNSLFSSGPRYSYVLRRIFEYGVPHDLSPMPSLRKRF